eukprot:6197885-Pleurochrysis_carterae.AAC.3
MTDRVIDAGLAFVTYQNNTNKGGALRITVSSYLRKCDTGNRRASLNSVTCSAVAGNGCRRQTAAGPAVIGAAAAGALTPALGECHHKLGGYRQSGSQREEC